MSDRTVIDYLKEIPAIYQMLGETHGLLGKMNFDRGLSHLVLLRASQINRKRPVKHSCPLFNLGSIF